MQLKRWESPRREGRNDKGRGGSASQKTTTQKAKVDAATTTKRIEQNK